MTESELRKNRTDLIDGRDLKPDSLVGSFFHGSDSQQWQGCIVAEPVLGVYLVELFSWIAGESTDQRLVRLDDMHDWRFYDTAEWMNNTYEHGLGLRWERLNSDPAKEGVIAAPDPTEAQLST